MSYTIHMERQTMEIDVSQAQGRVPVTIFHIKGDLSDENLLISRARQAVEAGAQNILLDLTDAPYISSGGLRGLHAVWMLLREDKSEAAWKSIREGIANGTYHSRHLKLLNPSRNAHKALTVSGYDMFLEIHKRLQAALDSF
jgi:anti-anti-sigma regulatory factor